MKSDREWFKAFVLEAIEAHPQGVGWTLCAKHVWDSHAEDLRRLGDIFYTWQYDMRWAMQVLRDEGLAENVGRGMWAPRRPT